MTTRPKPSMPRRLRRSADLTGRRLGRAVLGYLIAMVAIITLSPFRFALTPLHGFIYDWTTSDLLLNIVLFVPLGFIFQLSRPKGAPLGLWRALLFGAAFSASIETVQLFEASRYSSLMDVACNTLGCGFGAVIHAFVARRGNGRNALPTLTLDLPLMGLVYLLVPLAWSTGFASGNNSLRGWLALPLAAMAGNILGAVHAAYFAAPRGFSVSVHSPLEAWASRPQEWQPRWPRSQEKVGGTELLGFGLLPYLASLLWVLIALIPIGIHQPEIVIVGIIVALGSAWLRSLLTERRLKGDNDRRFEWLTLRQILPLFAAFILLSSLWPFDFAALKWQGMIALLPADVIANKNHVFLALEHVTAFLLLGYVLAELQGRNTGDFRPWVFRIVVYSGGISLLLEILRGMLPRQGASLFLFGFTVGASALGVWLYQLQRDHICALLSRNQFGQGHFKSE